MEVKDTVPVVPERQEIENGEVETVPVEIEFVGGLHEPLIEIEKSSIEIPLSALVMSVVVH